MEEIAAEAGITKPILYRHFGDKDGLHEALAERYVEELEGRAPPRREGPRRARTARRDDRRLPRVRRAGARALPLPPGRRRALPHRRRSIADFRRRSAWSAAPFTATQNLSRVGIEAAVGELWAHAVSGLIREAGIWWLESRALLPQAGRRST